MKHRGRQQQQGPLKAEMETVARLSAEGNDKAALHHAGKLVQRFPCHAYGWRAKAAIHTRRREHEAAASILTEAVKSIPKNADCWAELGYARIALGQVNEAEQALLRALELSPQRAEIMNALGGVRLSLGSPWQAFELVLRSLQLGETPINRNLFTQTVKRLKLRDVSADLRLILTRAVAEPWGVCQEFSACTWHVMRTTRGLGPSIERALQAYPRLLSGSELFGEDGFFVTTCDPLVQAVLSSFPVANQEAERFFTAVRAVMLDVAVQADKLDAVTMQRASSLCGALATQCFINEYVFSVSASETGQVVALKRAIEQALARGGSLPAIWLLALACYEPLYRLEGAEKLLSLKVSGALMHVIKQQVEEPQTERQLAASLVRLTPIAAGTSCDVQTMYEANPYPRWIKQTPAAYGASIDRVMQQAFPWSPYHPFNRANESIDILVAGCGTGQHPLGVAGQFPGARILAIDLSLASLGYAKRKTLEAGIKNIEYAQADITQLGILDRRFDVIESSGVLHHLADPWAGWEVLLRLLCPGGLMKLGFYSEIARRDIVRARSIIAERGYGVSVDEIRRARQDLLALDSGGNPLGFAVRSGDFFSTSGCRDLLFHVQEHRLTLPQIAAFLEKQGLCFIGFALDSSIVSLYQRRFPEDPAARNLANWHQFEQENPNTFVQMYQFWVQKQKLGIGR